MLHQWRICLSFLAVCVLAAGIGCDSGKPSSGGGSSSSAGGSSSSSGGSSESGTGSEGTSTETEGSDSGSAAAEGGWGTITGRFVYDGDPPAQTKLNVDKDVEFCTMNHPLTEEIVVDPETKGIANVVLMLYVARGKEAPTAHESYADAAGQKIMMDNEWCRFEPHVQFVQAGSTLEFGNKDKVGHNVKGDPFSNPAFNQTVAPGSALDVNFTEAERLPVKVSCTIHPWMTGWVVVQDHPYVAISGKDGSFELKNVPSGSWSFLVWQEKAGYLKQLKVGDKTENLQRGRWSVDVFDGDAEKNTIGDILVTTANFE